MADSSAAGAPGCSSTRAEPPLSLRHEGGEARQQQQGVTPVAEAPSAFPLLVFPRARKNMLPSGVAAAADDSGGSSTPQQTAKDAVSCSDSGEPAEWEHRRHSQLGMQQQHQQQPVVHQNQPSQQQLTQQQLQQQLHQQLQQQFLQQLQPQQQQQQLDIDADTEQKMLLARLELLLKEVALATGNASGVPASQADIKQQQQKPPQQQRRQRQQRQRPQQQQQQQQQQQRVLAPPEEALLMLVDAPESGDWRRRPQQKQQQLRQPNQTLLEQQQQLMQWLLLGPRERQQEQQQKPQKGNSSNSALSKQLLTRRSSSMMSSSTAAATGSSISTGGRTSASSTAVGGPPPSTGTNGPFSVRRNTGSSVADASETTDVLPLLLDLAFASQTPAAAPPAAAAAGTGATGASATPEAAPAASSPPSHPILSSRSQSHPTSNGKSRPSLSLPSLQQRMQKTKMCRFHMQGCCSKGALCVFAHDAKELRERPNLIRTRLCPLMRAASLSGVAGAVEGGLEGAAGGGGMGALGLSRTGVPHCSKGDACRFAHSLEELRSTPEFFKTAVCPLHAAGGPQACPLGASCRFAHGEAELRPRPHAGPPPAAAAAEVAGSGDKPCASESRRNGGSWGGGAGAPKGPPPGLEMMRDKRRTRGGPESWSLLSQQNDACASSTADPWMRLRSETYAVPNVPAAAGGSNGPSMPREAGRVRGSESAAVQWHKLQQKQRKQQQQKQQRQQQQLEHETSQGPWIMPGQQRDEDCGGSSSSSSCHCSSGASPGDLLLDSQDAIERWLLRALQQQQQQQQQQQHQQALHTSAAEAVADHLCDTSLSQGCHSGGYGAGTVASPGTSAAGSAVFLEPVSRVVGEGRRACTEEQQKAAALSITAALAAACGAVQQNKQQAPLLDTSANPFLVAADVPDSSSSSGNNSSSSSSIDLKQLGGVVTDFASESSTVCPFAATTASTQSNREMK
ncbi:hypothetical protein Emag_001112 [Eimeria magna]